MGCDYGWICEIPKVIWRDLGCQMRLLSICAERLAVWKLSARRAFLTGVVISKGQNMDSFVHNIFWKDGIFV